MLRLNTKNQPISEEHSGVIPVQQPKRKPLLKHSPEQVTAHETDLISGLYLVDSEGQRQYYRTFLLVIPLPEDSVIELLQEDDQIQAVYNNPGKDALLITVRVNPPALSYALAQDRMIEYFERKYQVQINP